MATPPATRSTTDGHASDVSTDGDVQGWRVGGAGYSRRHGRGTFGAMGHWADDLQAERIGETDGIVNWAVSPGVYIQEVAGHLTADGMERALRQLWERPDFVAPYGVVHVLDPTMTYDADMREFPNRPNIVPAVASAVVTPNALHRMVIAALGIASRLKRGTRVSSHAEVAQAVEHVRRLIDAERRAG